MEKGKVRYKYFGIPLERFIESPDDDFVIVRGFFTTDQKDEVGDIITRGATERAIEKYRRWGNIRYMHLPKPVAKVTNIGEKDGLQWNEVEIKVIDPEAVFAVKNGLLKALSVGIIVDPKDIELLEDGGWLINDYNLTEISLVDHPANYDAVLTGISGLVSDMARTRGADVARSYLRKLAGELGGSYEIELNKIEADDMEEEQVLTENEPLEIEAEAKVLDEEQKSLDEDIEKEKSPACRQEGETEEDCVARKIPEILEENPGMDVEQATAIAYSICEEKCGDSLEESLDCAPCEQKRSLDTEDEIDVTKGVIPYKDTGTADRDTEWEKPNLGDFTDESWEDLPGAEKTRIAAHYTYSVNSPPETFGDLKLPHHEPSKEGIGPAVWRGVVNAWVRRNQADIPDSAMESIEGHLRKHYEDFGELPNEDESKSLEPYLAKLTEVHQLVVEMNEKFSELFRVMKALTEAPHAQEEEVQGEDDQEQKELLIQRNKELEAKVAELQEKVELLSLPAQRKGGLPSVALPEVVKDTDEEGVIEKEKVIGLRYAVKNYLKQRTA